MKFYIIITKQRVYKIEGYQIWLCLFKLCDFREIVAKVLKYSLFLKVVKQNTISRWLAVGHRISPALSHSFPFDCEMTK